MKKCLYCDTDISHFAKNKIICLSILCLRKRDIESRKLPKEKYCCICNTDISNKRRDAKVCENVDCINTLSQQKYKLRIQKKNCIVCSIAFHGTDKSVKCNTCSKKSRADMFEKKPKVLQEVYCRKCKNFLFCQYKKDNGMVNTHLFQEKICDSCRSNLYSYDRSSNQTIRSRLGTWRRSILNKDAHQCKNCSSKKKLTVHHIYKFSDMISETLVDLNIDRKEYAKMIPGTIEFETISRLMISKHTLDSGITLCRPCHLKEHGCQTLDEDDD